jgi:hypothetical protein
VLRTLTFIVKEELPVLAGIDLVIKTPKEAFIELEGIRCLPLELEDCVKELVEDGRDFVGVLCNTGFGGGDVGLEAELSDRLSWLAFCCLNKLPRFFSNQFFAPDKALELRACKLLASGPRSSFVLAGCMRSFSISNHFSQPSMPFLSRNL